MKEKELQTYLYNHPEILFPNSNIQKKTKEYYIDKRRIDLLFKVNDVNYIVELKAVPLTREHVGQIIEYYGLMKKYFEEDNLKMILVAPIIPRERSTFLLELGIRCIEIREDDTKFIIYNSTSIQKPQKKIIDSCLDDKENKLLLNYFFQQKDIFINELINSNLKINFFFNPQSLSAGKSSNWFMMFRPEKWGKPTKGFGVYYSFRLKLNSKGDGHKIRVYLNLNTPLEKSMREHFKIQAIERISHLNLDKNIFSFYPETKSKPWEYTTPADNLGGFNAAKLYIKLTEANDILASLIKEFYQLGAFSKEIIFDS